MEKLWVDLPDAVQRVSDRLKENTISPSEASSLLTFVERGFVVFPGALNSEQVQAARREIDKAFKGEYPRLLYTEGYAPPVPLTEELKDRSTKKLLCLHAFSDSILQAILNPVAKRFLSLVFEEAPLLFQSLSFGRGSEQAIHQDTAYVLVNRPKFLVASWIALEDIQPGSGPLEYFVGSHRVRNDHLWHRASYGAHREWLEALVEYCEAKGFAREKFLAKAGDVLLWDAELAHGGAPIDDPNSTRLSVAAHFCPKSCEPGYFETGRKKIRPVEDAFWTTNFYD